MLKNNHVVIRSNSANTNIGIKGYVDSTDNTKGDKIYLYGTVGQIAGVNSSKVFDKTVGATFAMDSLHVDSDANISYLKVEEGHVENAGTIDLIFATTTDVKVTNTGDIDHAHVCGTTDDEAKGNAATLNGKSTGVTFDYNKNTEQNSNPDVYHHVNSGEEVTGDKPVTGVDTWKTADQVETAGKTIVDVAQGNVVKITGTSTFMSFEDFRTSWNTNSDFRNNASFELVGDVNLEGVDWSSPIGLSSNIAFDKAFDGKGYSIKNLTITNSADAAIFKYVSTATISNLVLENVNVTGTGKIAGLVSRTVSGSSLTLSKIEYKSGAITSGEYAGGLVGKCYGNIYAKDCINRATVSTSGTSDATGCGGIVACVHRDGYATTAIFDNCVNYGDLTTVRTGTDGKELQDVYAGGIVGYNYCNFSSTQTSIYSNIVFNNCENCGILSSTDTTMVGSLLGKVTEGSIAIYAKDCKNNGASITPNNCFGGAAGGHSQVLVLDEGTNHTFYARRDGFHTFFTDEAHYSSWTEITNYTATVTGYEWATKAPVFTFTAN